MKAQVVDRKGIKHLKLKFPGPIPVRVIPVEGDQGWEWNGDCEKPTIRPSLRSSMNEHVCHSYVTDGRIQFLDDSTHEMAGQQADLLDIE